VDIEGRHGMEEVQRTFQLLKQVVFEPEGCRNERMREDETPKEIRAIDSVCIGSTGCSLILIIEECLKRQLKC